MKCTVVIPIYDTGEIPKLIVQRGNSKVLRYDLTGKLNKMTSVFANNTSNMSANAGLQAIGKTLQVAGYDITVDEISYTKDAVQGYTPRNGEQILVIKTTFSNPMPQSQTVGFQRFTLDLVDTGGSTISWNRTLLANSNDSYLGKDIASGESIKGRYYFVVPSNTTPATLKFTMNSIKRSWSYAVTAVKLP